MTKATLSSGSLLCTDCNSGRLSRRAQAPASLSDGPELLRDFRVSAKAKRVAGRETVDISPDESLEKLVELKCGTIRMRLNTVLQN